MRRIFMELVDTKDMGSSFIDGARASFQIAQELMESKIKDLPPSEARFIIREYALNLERQMEWSNSLLRRLEKASEGSKSSSVSQDSGSVSALMAE